MSSFENQTTSGNPHPDMVNHPAQNRNKNKNHTETQELMDNAIHNIVTDLLPSPDEGIDAEESVTKKVTDGSVTEASTTKYDAPESRDLRSFPPKLTCWGESDLLKFLKVLKEKSKKYPYFYPSGFPKDLMSDLNTALPHRSVDEIEKVVSWFSLYARNEKHQTDDSFDKWYDVIDGLTPDDGLIESCYATAMRVCKESERLLLVRSNHIDNDADEPNYSRMYKYMESCFSEKPLPTLNTIEALIVTKCMDDLEIYAEKIVDVDDLKDYLRRVFAFLSQPKGKMKTITCENKTFFSEFYKKTSLLNPLGITKDHQVELPPLLYQGSKEATTPGSSENKLD